MTKNRTIIAAFLPVLAGFAVMAATPTWAESSTGAWVTTPYSKARIISAGPDAGASPGTWQIGVQITLDPGWKTYWRVPGDAGVPPVFDWSKSANVGDIRLEWPVPKRYVDEYATTIGYTDEVVFPVTVTSRDATKPVRASLELAYAVCKDICLPAQATLTLDLAASSGRNSAAHRTVIDEYRRRVPTPAASDSGALAAVSLQGGGAETKLVVDVKTGSATPDVFVEGPDEFYFGAPQMEQDGSGETRRLTVPVEGVTADSPIAGRKLRITVVDGDRLSEHEISIN